MNGDKSDGCQYCAGAALNDEATGFTCADKENIFTRREQAVLARIREAGKRARELKEEISRMDDAGRRAAMDELEHLRRLREELERERLAASEERMRLLGHI